MSMEGIASALLLFLEKKKSFDYKLLEPNITVYVEQSVSTVREYVHCAVLRNIRFTQESYNSFIKLQEKLHINACRNRTLSSIGTHDLDTIEPPFVYLAQKPREIQFIPLEFDEQVDAEELMQRLQTHMQLKKYLPIINTSPMYPVFRDKNNVVLSLPPIINSEHSKITLDTRNVFIEVTSTDQTKGKIVLDILSTTFSQYCDRPYEIERVSIVNWGGSVCVCPEWPVRKFFCNIYEINKIIGINLTEIQMSECIAKMGLSVDEVDEAQNRIVVQVPYTRPDVMHQCDIIEDIAVAYGYNNLPKTLANVCSVGLQLPINKISEELRNEFARMGYMEVLSFVLVTHEDNYEKLKIPDDNLCVELSNPKGSFQICRTSLLSGMLNSLVNNKSAPMPIQIFEIGDIVLKDTTSDVGSSNTRQLGALVQNNKSAGFEAIHGLLDRIMSYMEFSHENWPSEISYPSKYRIVESAHPTFFPGRCANVVIKDKVVGTFGTIHPDVLSNFKLTVPASALLLNIESLL